MSKKKKKSEGMPGFSEAREPLDSFDYVNMYGTYNIQPTADREDEYPAIAQGLSREAAAERKRARNEWKSERAKRPQNGGALEADPSKGPEDNGIPLPNDRK